MNISEVEIIIGTDGKIRLRTSGFSGENCLAATEDLETLLGNHVLSREQTSEFYDRLPVQRDEKIRIHR